MLKTGKTDNMFKTVLEHDALFSLIKALVAVVLAFFLGFVILLITGSNPVEAYRALFQGAFGSKRGFGETLLSTTPLIFGGLGFALAYRCKLFNIGLEGQIAVGGLVAAFLGYSIKGLPMFLHLPLCLVGAALGGAIWGFGPGFLKARYGIHEVISVIMMNHLAFKISAYMVSVQGPMKDRLDDMPASPVIMDSAKIVRVLPRSRLHWGILIAVLVAVVVWFILFKTRLGYRIRAVGQNKFAAEAGGIDVNRQIVIAMSLSGALGGLAGGVEILGVHYRLFAAFSPGYGFDSIAVALLGVVHPFGILGSAFLFGVLRSGSIMMQALVGVSKDMVSVVTAIIIFCMGMGDPLGRLIQDKFLRRSYGHSGKNS